MVPDVGYVGFLQDLWEKYRGGEPDPCKCVQFGRGGARGYWKNDELMRPGEMVTSAEGKEMDGEASFGGDRGCAWGGGAWGPCLSSRIW